MIDVEDRMTLDERPAAACILAQRMRSTRSAPRHGRSPATRS
ncbi:hypothetical protein [Streptomyces sp. SS1-1]|nr:hypothetical protein [Streptomyces sp. SS1-1]